MKQLKLLFLAVGLFVQGCTSLETPLFHDRDTPRSDEAVIVYNMYTTDSEEKDDSLLDGELQYFYLDSTWLTNDINVLMQSHSKLNHLSIKGLKSKYVVAKIPSGTYFLTRFYGLYGGGVLMKELTSPLYTSKFTPLVFSITAGEVKYLGDIEMVKSTLSWKSFIPLFKIHNRFVDAKKFMDQKYPSISGRLSEGLIHKSETQVLIEKKYTSDLKQK